MILYSEILNNKTKLFGFFSLLFFLPFLWAAESNGADKDELVYTLTKGDNLWNITDRYLDNGFEYWQPLLKINNVADPNNMLPGSTIHIPIAWLKIDPAYVKVRDTFGTVHYTNAQQTDLQKLTSESILHAGDVVVVGEDSNVVLEFADSSTLFLGSGSQIELLKTEKFGDSGLADSKVEIKSGRSESKVKRKNSRFQIKTPSASTTVRGTEFRVAVDRDNFDLSLVEVLGGVVSVSGAQLERRVAAGQGTTITLNQAPIPPVTLLPKPEIQSPPIFSRKLPVDIKWETIGGAKGYRVLIRKVEGEQTLFFDKVIQIPRINTSALEDGKYFIGVRAIDEKGLEGKESVYAFELDARPQPPLAIIPKPNETVRNDLPEFEWSIPEGSEKYHFQISANAEFSSFLFDSELNSMHFEPEELTPGRYYWRVSTITNGEEGPFSMTYSFTLRPSPAAPDVSAQSDENTITLMWPSGTKGQQYNVELAKDSEFTEILSNELLQEATWVIPRPSQRSFFRVRVIDIDGFESDWSLTQKIEPPPAPWYAIVGPFIPVLLAILIF